MKGSDSAASPRKQIVIYDKEACVFVHLASYYFVVIAVDH